MWEPLWSSKFYVPNSSQQNILVNVPGPQAGNDTCTTTSTSLTGETPKVKCKIELRSCLHSQVKLNIRLYSRT